MWIVRHTCGAVAVSSFRGAAGSVSALASLGAILSEGVFRADLAAVVAAESSGADATSVHGRALGVVLAVATLLAVFAKGVEGTCSRACFTGPADFADALARPRMAELRVFLVAFANLQPF